MYVCRTDHGGSILILLMIFIGVASVYISLYAGYALFVLKNSKSCDCVKKDPTFLPSVSLIICAYNEEKTISRKLENTLEIDYPKDMLELIVFDNGSTDDTFKIAKKFEKYGVKVYSLNGENTGKSAGLNVAFKLAKGDITAISDVDCFLKKDVLLKSMPYFADSSVGAVSGSQILLNPEESQSTQMEDSLQSYYKLIRKAESNIDSTIIYNGEFLAFRKNLIERLDEDVGADDTQIAIKIKESGHRALFLNEANFYEYAPSSSKMRWKQKVRRSSQVVQVLLRYRYMMFKRPDTYSRLIYPWNFFMHTISPFIFMSLLVMLAFMFIFDPFASALALAIFGFTALLGVVVIEVHLKKNLKGILSTLFMFAHAQLTLFIGFWSLMRRKPYKWQPLEDMRRY